MSAVTENDLKELKELINSKFEQVNNNLNEIKIDIAILKEGQNAINQRLDNTNKRIDNVDFINRSIFVSLLAGLILGLSKFLFPNL